MRTKTPTGLERQVAILRWQLNLLFAIFLLPQDPEWWVWLPVWVIAAWSAVALISLLFAGRGKE